PPHSATLNAPRQILRRSTARLRQQPSDSDGEPIMIGRADPFWRSAWAGPAALWRTSRGPPCALAAAAAARRPPGRGLHTFSSALLDEGPAGFEYGISDTEFVEAYGAVQCDLRVHPPSAIPAAVDTSAQPVSPFPQGHALAHPFHTLLHLRTTAGADDSVVRYRQFDGSTLRGLGADYFRRLNTVMDARGGGVKVPRVYRSAVVDVTYFPPWSVVGRLAKTRPAVVTFFQRGGQKPWTVRPVANRVKKNVRHALWNEFVRAQRWRWTYVDDAADAGALLAGVRCPDAPTPGGGPDAPWRTLAAERRRYVAVPLAAREHAVYGLDGLYMVHVKDTRLAADGPAEIDPKTFRSGLSAKASTHHDDALDDVHAPPPPERPAVVAVHMARAFAAVRQAFGYAPDGRAPHVPWVAELDRRLGSRLREAARDRDSWTE
ncbi:uncharacterized protein V1510DRAFT_436443, partial [Dipodascopsis tothii]|uniref:uncharacterized protein n=1 Tax=Dipodascopsis tothii TaxID=44089 RepID=UPI0034CEF48D